MSLQEQTKEARIVLNQLTESIDSIQSHLFAICSLSEQWQNSQNSFTLIQASLGSHINDLETKQREFELRRITSENQREQLELRQRRLESAERSLEERSREFEKKEKEWKEVLPMEMKNVTKLSEESKLKEMKFEEKSKLLEEREIRVQERSLMIELKEKEIEERCKAVELKENRIGEKCIEIERREKHVMQKCKLLEFHENRVNELVEREIRVQEGLLTIESKEKAIELKEKELEESRKRRQLSKKKISEGFKALEMREKQLNEGFVEYNTFKTWWHGKFNELEFREKALELREKEIEDRSKAIELEEKRIRKRRKILGSKESGIDKEKEEIRKRVVELENKEKGLEVREMAIDERFQALESKEMQINERFGDSCSMEVKQDELDKGCNEQGLKEKQVFTDEDVVIENAPYNENLCIADVAQRLRLRSSSICVNTLEGFLYRYNEGNDHELIGKGVVEYLQRSKIPTILVLRALHGIFHSHLKKRSPSHLKKRSPSHLKKCRRVFRPVFRPVITPVCEKFNVRSGCVFLLEQLLIMAPKISDGVKRDALEVANMWRENMSEDKSHNVVLGFLLLVVVYDLEQNFDRDDLKKFYAMIDGHRLAPELRLGLLLVEKSDGVLHMEGPVSSSTMNICNVFKPFCSNMDADGLRSSLIEHGPYPEKIVDALRFAKDPTKLVFNVVRSFNQPDSSTFDKANCIYLLEQLTKLQKQLSSDPLGSLSLVKSMNQSYLDCEVKCFASLWRRQLLKDDAEQLEIYGFLQFLVTFKLAKSYNKEELFKFFKRFYDSHVVFRPEQHPWLCQELGLRKKVAGLIKQLIKNNKRLQAVKYIHAFMQEYHYPLASVLKKHVEFIQEQAVKIQLQQEGSVVAELKAFQIELVHLRAVVHLIEDFELESEYFPLELTSRMKELEMWIADLKAAYQDAEGRYCSELASVDIEKELEKIDCTTNLDEVETVGNGSSELETGMEENNESVHSSGTGLKRILSPTTFPTRRSKRIRHLSKASVPSPTTMHPYLFHPIYTSFSPPPQGGTISSEHLG